MNKPTGLDISLNGGRPSFAIRKSTEVEDAIWRAVEEADIAGWTAEELKREFASAWKESKSRQLKYDMETLEK